VLRAFHFNPARNVDIHFTRDTGGVGLNSGFFVVKNTKWSRDFFDAVRVESEGVISYDIDAPSPSSLPPVTVDRV
jgi:hypothetical protein